MTFQIKKSYLATTMALSLSASNLFAAQVNTDPGDYRPLPDGYNLGVLYYQDTSLDTFYVDGYEIADGPTLSTNVGLARFVHYMEVGGFVIDPQVVLPFADIKLNAGETELSASGIGDPLMGATIWLFNDTKSQAAFGVTGWVSFPLGSYHEEQGAINVGENRYKLITQAAYVSPIYNKFSFEIIAEYTFFGDNDDFGSSGITKQQDAQYGVQTHLSYHMSDATKLAFSYYHDFGAETEVAGVKQNDELNSSRFQISVQHFLAPDWQAQVQYGRSISVENGFYEDSFVNLRLLKVF
ncbi:transporter [Aliiglaciecola sp. 2_MG-2023]|uniref:transporter n=1 Tax=unclassified Aliiglaciecola TaxID=2593648 RepID=UPI0026E305EC|nr:MULTISPECIES: transporter [unclassified Aliiglaciecola]MDO6709734.1 transporter [Aliiglaciecola sp. 2_MG-2023]MDO6750724.1 transporter [Aliiglaciecola sp. 1_MG-2023]